MNKKGANEIDGLLNIQVGQEYKFIVGPEELAKVLFYYGFDFDISGSFVKILCPFHEDKNPSMKIDLDEGKYFCFGCQESGDAFTFVKKVNAGRMNELQALQEYFKILRSKKTAALDFKNKHKTKRKDKKHLLTIAADYYYNLKRVNWQQLDNKNSDMLKCAEYMRKRGFTAKILNECGAKITYNKAYPIIFPMLDNGEFKGYVCRTTNPEIEKIRKYLYNDGFERSTTLVGDYTGVDFVYICEGYMDRLKFIQNSGIKNIIAVLGWKITAEQIKKLNDAGINKVVSALDNDECGKKGTEYLKKHFKVKTLRYLKGKKDPGELTRQELNKMLQKTWV